VPDLFVDTPLLTDLGNQLGVIKSEFANANTRSDSIAEATGHTGLAEAVTDFAHGWDDRREKFIENIEALAMTAPAIAEAFDETDQIFAKSLTDLPPPQEPATPGGPTAQ